MGGVFISYRREDAAGFAGRIYDRLTNSLGRDSVFIDVDNIPAGLDFVDVLSERVGRCDALVAIIGRNWLGGADNNSRRRLEDANDFVRIEIEAALTRKVPVIPVLVDGAVMPQADDLPDGLKKLARRQGIEISHTRFDSDAERLTDALARIEEAARQGDEEDARLPSLRDKKFATAASPGPNGDTRRRDGAPGLVRARSNVPRLALASAAVAIIVAFGAWFLTRGSTQAPRPTANLELPSAVTLPAGGGAEANANAAARQSIGDPAVVVGPAGKLLGDASNANAAAPSSNEDLAREIEQQKGALANASQDIDRLSKEANAATKNIKTGAEPTGTKLANAAARPPNPAPDASLTGKIPESAPANTADAVVPDPSAASRRWMNLQDFRAEYNRRIYAGRMYPDDLDARCQNGVPERRAHWSPRRAGQFYADPRIISEEDFGSDKADMIAKGFKIVSDRVYQSCEGPMRHITGWMKEG